MIRFQFITHLKNRIMSHWNERGKVKMNATDVNRHTDEAKGWKLQSNPACLLEQLLYFYLSTRESAEKQNCLKIHIQSRKSRKDALFFISSHSNHLPIDEMLFFPISILRAARIVNASIKLIWFHSIWLGPTILFHIFSPFAHGSSLFNATALLLLA